MLDARCRIKNPANIKAFIVHRESCIRIIIGGIGIKKISER
jgi:hypothetical protein